MIKVLEDQTKKIRDRLLPQKTKAVAEQKKAERALRDETQKIRASVQHEISETNNNKITEFKKKMSKTKTKSKTEKQIKVRR